MYTAIVSQWTGIPMNKLLQSEMQKLLTLQSELDKRVIGQSEATRVVSIIGTSNIFLFNRLFYDMLRLNDRIRLVPNYYMCTCCLTPSFLYRLQLLIQHSVYLLLQSKILVHSKHKS